MYKKPMLENSKSDDPLINEQEINQIFSNIEMLFSWNKNLVKDLVKSKQENSPVAPVFLKNVCFYFLFFIFYFFYFSIFLI